MPLPNQKHFYFLFPKFMFLFFIVKKNPPKTICYFYFPTHNFRILKLRNEFTSVCE